ncbi:MAG: hypothetical protein EOO52_12400 [Gammaproteobacteria bacterium]|nr:MAG: hypothetical protein EOO52_12400 [Gammaproteobacteria bacterium]
MKTFFVRILKALACGSALLMAAGSFAQELQKPSPVKDNATTYTVKPDYRKCAFPMCGGWYLTPVNQYSLQLENDDEAYQHSLLLPNTIYVSNINYKALGLTAAQIQELETIFRSGQGLVGGNVVGLASLANFSTKTLNAQAAWTSPTKTTAVGPYLKVSSSGIVCITTPCPYFTAQVINSTYTTNFHELTFEKAELDREQEARAWQAVSSGGLVLTGVKYESQGQVGTGTGISATKVFFAFPAKKSMY